MDTYKLSSNPILDPIPIIRVKVQPSNNHLSLLFGTQTLSSKILQLMLKESLQEHPDYKLDQNQESPTSQGEGEPTRANISRRRGRERSMILE